MKTKLPVSDNPLLQIPKMLKDSVGKMPAPLIVILVVSATVAVLVGVLLKLSEPQIDTRFLPLRLTVTAEKTIAPDNIVGFWAYEKDGLAMTIQLRGGGFEWLLANKSDQYTRFYARGSYRIEGDVLILQQRIDLGAPIDLTRLDIKYMPFNLSTVNMRLNIDGKKMTWGVEGDEKDRLPVELIVAANKNLIISWVQLSTETPSIP